MAIELGPRDATRGGVNGTAPPAQRGTGTSHHSSQVLDEGAAILAVAAILVVVIVDVDLIVDPWR